MIKAAWWGGWASGDKKDYMQTISESLRDFRAFWNIQKQAQLGVQHSEIQVEID